MEHAVKNKKQIIMIICTVVLSGLVAGLLYGYACSVNPGLHQLNNREYLSAMQSINNAILNPVFFISFMGSLAMFAVTLFQLRNAQTEAFYYMLAAMLIYVTGVFAITVFASVPLNNRLAGFNISTASEKDLYMMRAIFEKRWNAFHIIRTIASVAAFFLSIITLTKIK